MLLLYVSGHAADISSGYTFIPNEKNVNSTKLNSMVGGATINSQFFTDKSSTTVPVAGDIALIYQQSSGQFRKMTLGDLLFNQTLLITSQNETTAPLTNDFLLLYDTNDQLYKKLQLKNLLVSQSGLDVMTNPPPGTLQLIVLSNGVPELITLTNTLSQWWRWETVATNTFPNSVPLLSVHTAPTNGDYLQIWDTKNGTNKVITLAGVVTNLPTAVSVTNTDKLLIFSTVTNTTNPYGTNPVLSQVAMSTVRAWSRFTTSNIPVNVNSASTGTNYYGLHGLPGAPTFVGFWLVETNVAGDGGYVLGDRIPVAEVQDTFQKRWFTAGATATSLFLMGGISSSSPLVHSRTANTTVTLNMNNWNATIEAIYYP